MICPFVIQEVRNTLVVDAADEDREICRVLRKGWGPPTLWSNVRKKDCISSMEGRSTRRRWLGGAWRAPCSTAVPCPVGTAMVFAAVVVVAETSTAVEKRLLEPATAHNRADGATMERPPFSMNIAIAIVVCKSFKRSILCRRHQPLKPISQITLARKCIEYTSSAPYHCRKEWMNPALFGAGLAVRISFRATT